MRCLIYCAGVGERWAGHFPPEEPKQLVQIDGVPLLHRTVHQLFDRGIEPVIIAHDKRLEVNGAHFWTPPHVTETSVHTAKLALDLHVDRTLNVFGDVYFTDAALDCMVSDTRPIRFFGRSPWGPYDAAGTGAEIWGWAVGRAALPRIEAAFDAAIADVEERKRNPVDRPCNAGLLWQPYRHLCGFDLYEHRIDEEV